MTDKPGNDDVQKKQNPQVGGTKKESLPGLDIGYNEKYLDEYGKELDLEKEIKELGIEKVESGEVKIPQELAKEMGIKPTVTPDTPISQATGFSVSNVSLSDDQLTHGKKAPVKKSLRWLAEWFIYQLLKNGFIVRWVHGKASSQKKATKA